MFLRRALLAIAAPMSEDMGVTASAGSGSNKGLSLGLVASIAVFSVVFVACSAGGASVTQASASEAAALLASNPDVVVLDIRTPPEFDDGVIEGAINIDFYDPGFAASLDALDKDAQYVVYCRSGNRSGQAVSTFESLGFTNVTEIQGGIVEWYSTGLPVVAP